MRNLFSTWYAADLERYNHEHDAFLLSVHEDIINFRVESWPHMLMVAKSGFEKGPCTIGIEEELFIELKMLVENSEEVRFNSDELNFISGCKKYTINWREGERLSFAPFKIDSLDQKKALSAVKQYSYALEKLNLSTPSSALLGLSGGAEYFRLEIYRYFPVIIKSLLLKNEQEFIEACRKIIGMGHGSSPSGDDLICGALLAYHYLVADQMFIDNISFELKAAAGKTNLMGGHMLEIGRLGLAPEVFQALVNSISKGSFESDLFSRVTQIGSSSGIDLMIAMLVFIKYYFEFFKKCKRGLDNKYK